MSTLWIFSVPFTWLILPAVMIGHYLFGAYLLLFFTLINILEKWDKCTMLIREGAACNSLPKDFAACFMWLNPPGLLSISYILFCVWAGFRYSIYQLPNPILSYQTLRYSDRTGAMLQLLQFNKIGTWRTKHGSSFV